MTPFTPRTAVLAAVLLCLASCRDFLETDISKKTVQLVSPAAGVSSGQLSQQLRWDAIDGASSYKISIASPGFDSIRTLVVDETEDNSFTVTLAPGKYQWTVHGLNSAYESKGEIFDLTIINDSTQNLAGQVVQLVAPASNGLVNQSDVTFLWKQIAAANQYHVQVASPNFSNSTFIIDDFRTSADNHHLVLPEGKYRWRVRAENDISVTLYSEGSFEIDLTGPPAPVLTSPANNASLPLPVTLSWQSDLGSIRDSLFVYGDSLSSQPVFSLATTNNTYNFTDTNYTVYFWRVRSVDGAGNASAYSQLRKFLIQ